MREWSWGDSGLAPTAGDRRRGGGRRDIPRHYHLVARMGDVFAWMRSIAWDPVR